MMVANAVPEHAAPGARASTESMDFGFYYDPNAGLIRGGAWPEQPPGCSVYDPATDVWFTCHHYGSLNTEPRIASYIGIARGEIPAAHYFKMWRTLPADLRLGLAGDEAGGRDAHLPRRRRLRGALHLRRHEPRPELGRLDVRGADGAAARARGAVGASAAGASTTRSTSRAQIYHGLEEAEYGYWGFSPSNNPDGGYREYGVDPIGLNADGYASDQERTFVDYGFEGCRPAQPPPTTYGRGVVTPHASFLALDFATGDALANLAKLRRNFDAYGAGGFYDAVDVVTGKVSQYYLALDQGMVMAAIANELGHDRLQAYFAREIEAAVRPVIGKEEFTAGGGR